MNLVARGIANIMMRRLTGRRRLVGNSALDPARFSIGVEDASCLERIRSVLGAFFSGFEAALKGAPAGEQVPPLYRPFFEEGLAMGFLPHGYLKFVGARKSLHAFEAILCRQSDPFTFLRYVGLGFWLGFRYARRVESLQASSEALTGRRYRHLVHDGYGFKLGFFDLARAGWAAPYVLEGALERLRKDEQESLARENLSFAVRAQEMEDSLRGSLPTAVLERLEGFARFSAFHGVGRSLWFFFMDKVEAGLSLARALLPDTPAIVGGMGLAAAYTFVDDLERAYVIAAGLEAKERRHFHKGIRIALYLRSLNDQRFLQECLERQAPSVRQRAAEDLEHALAVGEATSERDDFIEAFHQGCL